MELSSEEASIPIPTPLNSRYGGHDHDHLLHRHHNHHDRNHVISATAANGGSSPVLPTEDLLHHHHHNGGGNNNNNQVVVVKKGGGVRYKECLKNHAASMGGNATDGCGEFMPAGEEGSIEALTCSACNCHRNFHRKETDGDPSSWLHHPRLPRKLIMPPDAFYPTAAGAFISSRATAATPQHMIMSYNMVGGGQSESEEQEPGPGPGPMPMMGSKKRFRTKFSAEQKEKMLRFAEKVGWKIQKQEESVVQQFCQEIGVKRRVLKVWMHNNKHNLGKTNTLNLKDDDNNNNTTNSPSPTPLN